MSRKSAAVLLDVNVTTIDAYVRRRMLPRYYLPTVNGGLDVSPRFRVEDLEAILAQR
jgi:hypothetical protein